MRFETKLAAAVLVGGLLALPGLAETAGPPALKAGDKLPTIMAPGASDGRAQTLDFPKGRHTVLLLFLPDCSHCHKMIPEWNRAFARKPAGLEVVGLMLGPEPPGFFKLFPLAFPVLRYPMADARTHFKLERVPMTVRVGPGGVVVDATHGVIDPIRVGELFRP